VPVRQKIHRPDAVAGFEPHERRQPAAPAAVRQPGAADRRLQLFAGPGSGAGGGLVHDAVSARAWIVRGLHEVMAQWDAPLFWRLLQAFAARDDAAVRLWSECFLASRDTAEFRAETVQMGYSLSRLIAELGVADTGVLWGSRRRCRRPSPAPSTASASRTRKRCWRCCSAGPRTRCWCA
jgi:hypothetical protein